MRCIALLLVLSSVYAFRVPPNTLVRLPSAAVAPRRHHPLAAVAVETPGESSRSAPPRPLCSPLAAPRTPPRVVRALTRACARAAHALGSFVLALIVVIPLPAVPATLALEAPTSLEYVARSAPAVLETGLPSVVRMPETRLPDALLPKSKSRQKTSFVTAAVNSVGPAVVRIDTERLVDRAPIEGYLFPGLEPEGQRREAGQGSGVILSGDGLILTNAHVVNNAAKVTVTLTDGRTFEGLVKGQDDYMDLAAVKIKPSGRPLPTAPLGRSDELQVGDWVIAIGNAVGLDSTVTLGIVSSLQRSAAEVGIPNKKVNFIQTDAAINPGNSGGPLLNEFGEVIGINTAIRANAAGIGFAIPIDTAERAMKELKQGKKISHAYLGISMSSLTAESARQNNADPNSTVELPELEGALVLAVAPDTPAARAGFKKFDVITELGGRSVKTAADAQAVVDGSRVGQSLLAKVERGLTKTRQSVTLSVTTGDLSERAGPNARRTEPGRR